jgi:hypothetical protein
MSGRKPASLHRKKKSLHRKNQIDACRYSGWSRPRTVSPDNGTVMPEPKDAAECRRVAEHYVACAKQMTDPFDRATFLNLADYWTRVAEQLEKKEGEKPQNGTR